MNTTKPVGEMLPADQALALQKEATTTAGVQEFLAEKAAEAGAPGESAERVRIPADDTFSATMPDDLLREEAVANEKVVVTDAQKMEFLKALLNDERFTQSMLLFGGKLRIEIRSRTLIEQRRIMEVLTADTRDGVVDKDSPVLSYTRFQYYTALLMVRRVNEQEFSDVEIRPEDKLEDIISRLRAKVDAKLPQMNGPRWQAVLKAMSRFEALCAKLSEEAINEDFWKTPG